MSNELEQKAKTLAQMLADNHLTKIASDQQIEHTSPEAQTGIGKLEWDGSRATNNPAANKFVKTTYREGWELPRV